MTNRDGSNKRDDNYGGSFENRTRFLLEIIDRIHSELGSEREITCRLGIYDAIPYPYGWGVERDDYTKADLTEPKRLIRLLVIFHHHAHKEPVGNVNM